ncbi:reverse transcriptase domain-containing protein [Rhizobium sp. 9140]|uniref:reverse transcriptase domain-containing protein n=1 Tax=Rhizobium sp. 9140 TaxID=1761900 RepID=UPI0007997AD2|nr:reverse transcriptase domain-containing protein [Rhizobium sp. 9140]CZT35433.1 Reverse transcriptase (RNA-dependent DNA polymerase) [Rhizobium sp. 9140]
MKFRSNGERKKKTRPLRYASRVDAAIYARYRVLLSKLYEDKLYVEGLQDNVIAYRELTNATGGSKSNINFAFEVFDFINDIGDCYVTVVDIKSYFESLEHNKILQVWERLLGSKLPPDHLAIFKSLTAYSVVDLDQLFDRLKLNSMIVSGTRQERRRRKIDQLKADRFKQICTPSDFKSFVSGRSGLPSLIQKNSFDFGIPQGTPISDLVANFYLIDFDKEIADFVSKSGGLYRRYSDDIIIVLPKNSCRRYSEGRIFLQKTIRKYGRKLKIQDKKTSVTKFSRSNGTVNFARLFGTSSANGLEYLGFEFDGTSVRLRNKTMSNAWRRMKRRSYGHASRFVKQYRGKGKLWLNQNYPFLELETRILRDVTIAQDVGVRSWTFIRYVRRSNKVFIKLNPKFSMQTKRYRRMTKTMIAIAFGKAMRVHFRQC